MKPITFLGDSLKCLRGFADDARRDAGYQLRRVQQGHQPHDFKPMPTVGHGVEEVRLWSEEGTFRVIYLARLPEAVCVHHAFQKKTPSTAKTDVQLATTRFRALMKDRP
jgi:phage-related protein